MSALILRAITAIAIALCPIAASAQGLRVVARVNDDAITDFALNQRVLFAIRTAGLQDSPEMRQRLSAQMLRHMIDERLQIQDARRLGLRVTEAEIAQRVGELERASGMQRGLFRQYVQGLGVAVEAATDHIESTLAWAKIVRRRVRPQVDVSEAEIDDALARVRSNVGKTEARVAEIFVPIDRVDQADDARRSADRIVEQLRRGVPFSTLAQQFSQGATAQGGGDLGWILPGSLDPNLDAAIEKLQVRQASEPVRSPAGWHIVYVIDRRPFASAQPDDVRLNLVQMTLALPVNASAEETSRATAEAQKAMAAVRKCNDLHALSRQVKGSTAGDLNGLRVGDLQGNRQMYEELPRLAIGAAAGPFRVAEGLQVVSLCSKEGGDGMPTRDAVAQQLLLQKLESAGRRYMRDLRRGATIEIKP